MTTNCKINKITNKQMILLNVQTETKEGRASCQRMSYQQQNNTSAY